MPRRHVLRVASPWHLPWHAGLVSQSPLRRLRDGMSAPHDKTFSRHYTLRPFVSVSVAKEVVRRGASFVLQTCRLVRCGAGRGRTLGACEAGKLPDNPLAATNKANETAGQSSVMGQPPIAFDADVDVLIVGSGVAGLSAAMDRSRRSAPLWWSRNLIVGWRKLRVERRYAHRRHDCAAGCGRECDG